MSKEGEKQAKSFMNHLLEHVYDRVPYSQKFRDKTYCLVCGTVQPKNTTAPDYLLGLLWDYVEVKGPHKSWNFVTGEPITDVQREKLSENFGWLFVELGEGRRPGKLKAFFVPWDTWISTEALLLKQGQKSIPLDDTVRSLGASRMLGTYRLRWEDGHWVLPWYHVYWSRLEQRLAAFRQGVDEWKKIQAQKTEVY